MTTAHGHNPTGYLAAARSTASPRTIEYHVFSRVTGALNAASTPDAPFSDLVSAVHENLMLWSEIALAVSDGDNALPAELRARLFYLSEFTRAHTQKVLRREADALALIDINTLIIGGLRAAKSLKEPERCPA